MWRVIVSEVGKSFLKERERTALYVHRHLACKMGGIYIRLVKNNRYHDESFRTINRCERGQTILQTMMESLILAQDER